MMRIVSRRFKDYDGQLLSELASMQQKSPDAIYNALMKENFSLTDVVRLNRAMKQLFPLSNSPSCLCITPAALDGKQVKTAS